MQLFRKKKNAGINGNPQDSNAALNNARVMKDHSLISPDGMRGLDAIYAFLQGDYETTGYNDALTNPDESYRNDNVKLLMHDLMILIDRSSTYYETMLKEMDFHISSRGRAGLIDLVEELKIKKEVANDHLGKVMKIKEEVSGGQGPAERIILSYQRGFLRGLSAISQSKLFNGGM